MAIARCHRMGQIRPVDVHRLLAEDSVNKHMLEVLRGKGRAVRCVCRRSDMKESSPDAVDVSDLVAVQQVASDAEAEHRIVELERRRLGLEPQPA